MRCGARAARYGRNRRLTWPAKPPFPARILMSGTGTASVYRVWRSHPFFRTCDESQCPPQPVMRSLPRACLAEARLRAKADAGRGRGEGVSALGSRIGLHLAPDKNASNRQIGPRFTRVRAVKGRAGPKQAADFRPRKPCLARHPRLLTPDHRGPAPYLAPSGEVAEWSNAPHSKCGIGASLSGVRIPPSPPNVADLRITQHYGPGGFDGVGPPCRAASVSRCHRLAVRESRMPPAARNTLRPEIHANLGQGKLALDFFERIYPHRPAGGGRSRDATGSAVAPRAAHKSL